LIVVTGCTAKEEAEPLVIDVYTNGAVSEEPSAAVENLPAAETSSGEYKECFEAYLGVLKKNSQRFVSDDKYFTVADGKIAVMDVLGDKTPELLYIYIPEDNPYAESFKIFTYSEADGVVSVYDYYVFIFAGGGNSYCVYLTNDGELMVYYASHNQYMFYGFWNVIPTPGVESSVDDAYYFMENTDSAKLLYEMYYGEEDAEPIYKQSGKEISENDFNKNAIEIMGNIGRVIFQSSLPGTGGMGLYERDDLWIGVKPFEENCMTYAEAISWLEN